MIHFNARIVENAEIRRAQFEGREHIVAPVVLMVEGVHRGSGGPLFYSAEELQASAHLWNGVPVPIHHPEQNGQPVSCNSPDVIQSQSVGRLWNVQYEDSPVPRLRGEVWVDVNKAQSLSPAALSALTHGQPLEVSTGLFSDDEMVDGMWNNEEYNGIVRNIRPDHLALLPGATGACSWQDGCGIRANKEEEEVTDNYNPNHDARGRFASGGGGGGSSKGSGKSSGGRYEFDSDGTLKKGTIVKVWGEDHQVISKTTVSGPQGRETWYELKNKVSGRTIKSISQRDIEAPSRQTRNQEGGEVTDNYNPNHDPHSGEFTSGGGGGGSFRYTGEPQGVAHIEADAHQRSLVRFRTDTVPAAQNVAKALKGKLVVKEGDESYGQAGTFNHVRIEMKNDYHIAYNRRDAAYELGWKGLTAISSRQLDPNGNLMSTRGHKELIKKVKSYLADNPRGMPGYVNNQEGGEMHINTVEEKEQIWNDLHTNVDMGMDEKMSKVRKAVYAMDGPTCDNMVQEIYDDCVVYNCGPGPQSAPGTPTKMYKRSYSIDDSGNVTMGDDMEEVRKEVNYVPVTNSEADGNIDPRVIAANRAAKIFVNFNPNHDPHSGEFTSGGGGGGSSGNSQSTSSSRGSSTSDTYGTDSVTKTANKIAKQHNGKALASIGNNPYSSEERKSISIKSKAERKKLADTLKKEGWSESEARHYGNNFEPGGTIVGKIFSKNGFSIRIEDADHSVDISGPKPPGKQKRTTLPYYD